ncbi:PucR family transcriptional regulator [Rhodococcus sp. T2V]|uniref:PucR family transcriptional regulator n=1 Tax=Rhodococcus sp. T2V TaxID=3034164 RepID=UPI0023E2DA49|nr:helix-turn-helix domain-containing protein [Rhodococcus sp. T2V]MDF3304660.1 helix-turn-helix domain-containing protein [Rhodococcus sp. T2V]
MTRLNSDGVSSDTDQRSAVRTLVATVYAATNAHSVAIAEEMITRTISEIDEVTTDLHLVQLLTACAEAATSLSLAMLEHDRDTEPMPMPIAMSEYARVLAQRGLPITVLDRGYRLTHNTILRWCLEQLETLGTDPAVVAQAAVEIMTRLSTQIDGLYEQMLDTYELEYETWLRHRSTARSARIGDLLDGRPVDVTAAESTLGYQLDQFHLGLIAWIEPGGTAGDLPAFERAVTALAGHLGCRERPLFEPRDERTVWAWLPLGSNARVDIAGWTTTVEKWDQPITVALGAPQHGMIGFVRTHRQAAQATVVARASNASGPRVVPIGLVGAVALMCENLDSARRWVRDVLGPLAVDDPTAALHRQTLRTFFSTGGSYTAAAAALTMHKNTVIYRIHKIEELLGKNVREGRLELENALALCYWLGTAVLDSGTNTTE